jgi:hypothetical protein
MARQTTTRCHRGVRGLPIRDVAQVRMASHAQSIATGTQIHAPHKAMRLVAGGTVALGHRGVNLSNARITLDLGLMAVHTACAHPAEWRPGFLATGHGTAPHEQEQQYYNRQHMPHGSPLSDRTVVSG